MKFDILNNYHFAFLWVFVIIVGSLAGTGIGLVIGKAIGLI